MALPSRETVNQVYLATKEMLKHSTEPLSPGVLHKNHFQGVMAPSSVSVSMRMLADEGYLKSVTPTKPAKRAYVLTDKDFGEVERAPVEEYPKSDLDILEKDVGDVIEFLEIMQDTLPRLLAKLLDISKNIKKFRKVKELLANMTETTRKF